MTMRLIGHLKDESQARTFSGYLTSTDIRNNVEPDAEGWAIWVYSEDQIEAGLKALDAFVRNPGEKKYQIGLQAAEVIERKRAREEEQAAKRIHTRERIWRNSNFAPVTMALMAITLLVTLKIGLEPTFGDFHKLAIDEYEYSGHIPFVPIAVRAGEYWRLLTPIFVHFGPMHLFFDVYMLWNLGSVIEVRRGSLALLLMVVVIGVLSNWAEYLMGVSSFGGLSGVDYGLFGYIWMRGYFDPRSGFGLTSQSVLIMISWYFLCLVHVIPDIANTVHTVGLAVGMLWGASVVVTNALKR